MRKALDRLYWLTGIVAAFSLVAILVLVVIQMGSRMFRVVIPGTDDFAAYALVAATFLGLAPTFKAGAHIRVQVVLDALPRRAAWFAEIWALAVGLALTTYFAWWTLDFVHDSWRFNEVATAMVATPLWIPRSAMFAGLAIFAIALADELVTTIRRWDIRAEPSSPDADTLIAREL